MSEVCDALHLGFDEAIDALIRDHFTPKDACAKANSSASPHILPTKIKPNAEPDE